MITVDNEGADFFLFVIWEYRRPSKISLWLSELFCFQENEKLYIYISFTKDQELPPEALRPTEPWFAS